MSHVRWGFLGTGNIARSMAAALPHVPGARPAAVASRTLQTAEDFAATWGFAHAYGSYEALMHDPGVDIIYVATPNALHKENILAALNAGKNVLCEKPLSLCAEDSAACFDYAETKDLFLMEALWTAFFPAMQKAIQLVQSGAIGTPRHITANFISLRDPVRHPNLFNPALGGGARNDLGIYPLSAALLLAGPVAKVQSHSLIGTTGVDVMTAWSLEHENGALSQLCAGFQAEMPIALRCTGSTGYVEIAENFHHPSRVILATGGSVESFDLPYLGNGYAHEAIAFQTHIKDRKPVWGRQHTQSCAALLAQPCETYPS